MKKLLFFLLLGAQSLMAIPKDRSDSQRSIGMMVATCAICEKHQKELEEQEEAMSHYHSHAIIHRKEQR
ncbi:hypothetical protein [Helicobacter pylori]|uniref:hypothetical protein n=1 Tax=Helicobacter pylori TaxID=210 RepID=UPI000EADCCFF|nr:hypothetical protein [Helicobacter pylori]